MKAVPARKPESEHTGVERAMNRRVYLNPVLARRHLSKDSGRPLLGSTLLLSGEPGHGTEDVASMMPNQSIAASESCRPSVTIGCPPWPIENAFFWFFYPSPAGITCLTSTDPSTLSSRPTPPVARICALPTSASSPQSTSSRLRPCNYPSASRSIATGRGGCKVYCCSLLQWARPSLAPPTASQPSSSVAR